MSTNCDGSCADCGCHPTETEIYEMAGERDAALAEVEKLRAALLEAGDALSNLRHGRWEIGYVNERVDRILMRIAELRALATASPPAAQSPPDTSDT